MRTVLLGMVLGGWACSGDAHGPVTVHAPGSSLAAVRTDGAWQPLTLDLDGDAVLEVTGPTQVVHVCEVGVFTAHAVAFGPGAGRLDIPCAAETPSATFTVHIEAPPHVRVSVDGQPRSGGSDSQLAPGTYDFIAYDESVVPPRIEIRRDIEIASDTTVTFDVAANGTALRAVAVRVKHAFASPNITTATLKTARGGAGWSGTATSNWIVPASALVDGEQQSIVYSEVATPDARAATAHIVGDETAIELALPEYLPTTTLTEGSEYQISWAGDADYDTLRFSIADFVSASVYIQNVWAITAYPSYFDAGARRKPLVLPDLTKVPGWASDWTSPGSSTRGKLWRFEAEQDTEHGTVTARRSDKL